jgi:hypothetical protein
MGLVPNNAGNPFAALDARGVLGTFKASGATDPDVLHAEKETLLLPQRNLKKLAWIGGIIGGLFTVTIFMAWFGIPLLLGTGWLWRFQARNTTAIEDGYAEYLRTIQA